MDVVVVKDAQAVAAEAAGIFVEVTAGATAARGKATVVLTGGSSAAPFFAELRGALRRKVHWDRVHFFFSDDRAENIASARERGWHGILHTGYRETVAALRALGVGA